EHLGTVTSLPFAYFHKFSFPLAAEDNINLVDFNLGFSVPQNTLEFIDPDPTPTTKRTYFYQQNNLIDSFWRDNIKSFITSVQVTANFFLSGKDIQEFNFTDT